TRLPPRHRTCCAAAKRAADPRATPAARRAVCWLRAGLVRAGRELELADVALLGAIDRLAPRIDPGELEARAPGQIHDRARFAARPRCRDAPVAREESHEPGQIPR